LYWPRRPSQLRRFLPASFFAANHFFLLSFPLVYALSTECWCGSWLDGEFALFCLPLSPPSPIGLHPPSNPLSSALAKRRRISVPFPPLTSLKASVSSSPKLLPSPFRPTLIFSALGGGQWRQSPAVSEKAALDEF